MSGFTARLPSRADTQVGESDPKHLSGNCLDHRIKGTPGITGSYFLRVPIDGNARHLDVVSSHPAAAGSRKGWTVRPLKRYVKWVQNVVRQFGFYLRRVFETAGKIRLYERTIWFPPLVHLLSLGRHSRKATWVLRIAESISSEKQIPKECLRIKNR